MNDDNENVVAKKINLPFYYDRDVYRGSLTSVTLHPNTKLDDSGNWIRIDSTEELCDNEGYREQYICKSILAEDYTVAASNSWSEFGEDIIGKMFNNLRPWAPILGEFSDVLSTASAPKSLVENSTAAGILEKGRKLLVEGSKKASKLLGNVLVSQGTRFSYYSGTDTSFANLGMKFTVFSDWINGEFRDCDSQLRNLYPYIMGKYTSGVVDTSTGVSTDGSNINTGVTGDNAELLNEFFGWQRAPGGYMTDTTTVDNYNFGTLKLKFGAFYSLSGLVCTSAQFTFSKQMTKYWDGTKNVLKPLYCEVALAFQPTTRYSNDALVNFISGKTMIDEVGVIETGLNQKLNDVKDEIDTLMGNSSGINRNSSYFNI